MTLVLETVMREGNWGRFGRIKEKNECFFDFVCGKWEWEFVKSKGKKLKF